jgi:hypothetical protein
LFGFNEKSLEESLQFLSTFDHAETLKVITIFAISNSLEQSAIPVFEVTPLPFPFIASFNGKLTKIVEIKNYSSTLFSQRNFDS